MFIITYWININTADEIKVLRYEHIGSMHIPHARYKDKRPSLDSFNLINEDDENKVSYLPFLIIFNSMAKLLFFIGVYAY